MRLFIALDIDEAIRRKIGQFMDGVRGFAPEVRWVHAESFHITLKFIGEQTPEQMEAIKRALAAVQGNPTMVSFRGYGFFPSTKSARVFWVGMEADQHLGALAKAADAAVAALGVPPEEREYTPHLTLARSGSGRPQRMRGDAPNRAFARLQEKLAPMPPPDFGTMTAREFFLYQSKLSPKGAEYTKLGGFRLSS